MTDILTPFTPSAPPLSPAGEQPSQPIRKRGRKPRATAPEAPAKRQRKPREVAKMRKQAAMKLPVDTMLAALSELKGDDAALFEKLLGILNAAGKPQRNRVMAALAKVFA